MSSIRRILAAVDFSEHSRVAFDHAAELARAFGAILDVLFVWEPPVVDPPGPLIAEMGTTLWDVSQRNADQALAEFVAEASKRGISVSSSRAIPGTPANAIVEAARSTECDLIVVGTHGRTGLSRALIGSVAERVVRHAHCTVVCVRKRGESPATA